MGLGKDPSLGEQGRDKGDRNDRTPVARMMTAGETIGLRGKQMGFWSALGERKSESRSGEVRRGQSMKAYVCHPTETGRSLLRGGRMPVLEQCMARQSCRQQQQQSSQEARMAVQAAGDAGSPNWGRVGLWQQRGGVACERYLKEDAVELGSGL